MPAGTMTTMDVLNKNRVSLKGVGVITTMAVQFMIARVPEAKGHMDTVDHRKLNILVSTMCT